ncbi:MAG: hypothetical protein ACXW2A_15355 [Burkholderiales bacterium]
MTDHIMEVRPKKRALRRFRHSLDWLQGASLLALVLYLGAIALLQ